MTAQTGMVHESLGHKVASPKPSQYHPPIYSRRDNVDYTEFRDRRGWQKEAEAGGRVADSMEVRLALMEQVRTGEITLEAAQSELKRIKSGAKRNGQITRNQAFLGR